MTDEVAFALASALHAGLQLTVTVLVYPSLAAGDSSEWVTAHHRHSRAISPLVGFVYGALLLSGAVLVASAPGPLGVVGLVAAVVAIGVTAAFAAPLHGRLLQHDPALLAQLLVVDRWRCAAAVIGAAAAAAGAVAS